MSCACARPWTIPLQVRTFGFGLFEFRLRRDSQDASLDRRHDVRDLLFDGSEVLHLYPSVMSRALTLSKWARCRGAQACQRFS